MRFLIENARIGYIDKEIEGVTPYEPGVSISVTTTGSLWSDVEETKQYYLFELLQDIVERYSYWKKQQKIKKTTLFISDIISVVNRCRGMKPNHTTSRKL